jgi:catalase (peroxidase I)
VDPRTDRGTMQEKLVRDFVSALVKVMELDRFDIR